MKYTVLHVKNGSFAIIKKKDLEKDGNLTVNRPFKTYGFIDVSEGDSRPSYMHVPEKISEDVLGKLIKKAVKKFKR